MLIRSLLQPHDAIDFTDNDIQVLGNFPLSPRIRTLLLARNRIAQIQSTLPNAIPNLKNLVLASNNIGELADLEVLGRFPRLTHLVLTDNPVTKKEVRHTTPLRCPVLCSRERIGDRDGKWNECTEWLTMVC